MTSTGAEEGWLSGKLNGATGWFPEAYCTPYEGEAPASEAEYTAPTTLAHQESLSGAQTTAPVASTEGLPEIGRAVALYDWFAKQQNQMNLTKGIGVVVREELVRL